MTGTSHGSALVAMKPSLSKTTGIMCWTATRQAPMAA